MKHLDSPGLLFQLKTYFMCLYLVIGCLCLWIIWKYPQWLKRWEAFRFTLKHFHTNFTPASPMSCSLHFGDVNMQVSVCLSPVLCLLGPGEVCKPASSHPRNSYSQPHRGICQTVFVHWGFWQFQLLVKIRSFVLDKEVLPKCGALCCVRWRQVLCMERQPCH